MTCAATITTMVSTSPATTNRSRRSTTHSARAAPPRGAPPRALRLSKLLRDGWVGSRAAAWLRSLVACVLQCLVYERRLHPRLERLHDLRRRHPERLDIRLRHYHPRLRHEADHAVVGGIRIAREVRRIGPEERLGALVERGLLRGRHRVPLLEVHHHERRGADVGGGCQVLRGLRVHRLI